LRQSRAWRRTFIHRLDKVRVESSGVNKPPAKHACKHVSVELAVVGEVCPRLGDLWRECSVGLVNKAEHCQKRVSQNSVLRSLPVEQTNHRLLHHRLRKLDRVVLRNVLPKQPKKTGDLVRVGQPSKLETDARRCSLVQSCQQRVVCRQLALG
jgi:hypothetical protein